MVVRPNKAIIDREICDAKAHRWAEIWPEVLVMPLVAGSNAAQLRSCATPTRKG